MADKKPEYAQDNKPTNEPCPACGRPTKVHMNVPTGRGRVFCPCGWNDTKTTAKQLSQVSDDPKFRKPRRGVRTVSSHHDSAQGQEGVKTITIRDV